MKKRKRILIIIVPILIVAWIVASTFGAYRSTPEAAVRATFPDAQILETIWLTENEPICLFTSYKVNSNGEHSFNYTRFKSKTFGGNTIWRWFDCASHTIVQIKNDDRIYTEPMIPMSTSLIDEGTYLVSGVTQSLDIEHCQINGKKPISFKAVLDGQEITFWYILGGMEFRVPIVNWDFVYLWRGN
jgi:hypothetical protein